MVSPLDYNVNISHKINDAVSKNSSIEQHSDNETKFTLNAAEYVSHEFYIVLSF